MFRSLSGSQVWACGSVVAAVRKTSAAGSQVAFVELEIGGGYLVEANPPFVPPKALLAAAAGRTNVSAAAAAAARAAAAEGAWAGEAVVGGGAPLEQLDGRGLVESASPEERDVGEAFFRVVHPGGLLVRAAPRLASPPASSGSWGNGKGGGGCNDAEVDGSGSDGGGGEGRSEDGSGAWGRAGSGVPAEVLPVGACFRGVEVLRPAGSDATFVRLGNQRG